MPFEVATGQKPDLSYIRPWGCKAWVKRLDVGKLKPRAEECRFIGVDVESKGYRVYWPGKNRVSVERDVYFDKNEALEHDEVQIEGENDDIPENPTNSTSNQPPLSQSTSQPVENRPIVPEIVSSTNEITENSHNNSATPQQRRPARRNSLEGLPQFDNEEFGRGKRRRVPTSRTSAAVVDAEEPFDDGEVVTAVPTTNDVGCAVWAHFCCHLWWVLPCSFEKVDLT